MGNPPDDWDDYQKARYYGSAGDSWAAQLAHRHREQEYLRRQYLMQQTLTDKAWSNAYTNSFTETEPVPQRRTGMNYQTAVFLINKDVRAIRASYEENAKQGIFKTMDASIKVDDIIVVPTNTRHKFTCVKVTEVDVDLDVDTTEVVLWVADKVNLKAHADLIEMEEKAVKTIRSAELLKKREDLAEALFKDNVGKLKALPMAKLAGHK